MTRDGDQSPPLPGRATPRRPGSRRAASSPGQPQLVRELLAGYLDKSGLRAGVEAASILEEWDELVGPGIAAVTRVDRVSGGILVVAVATSAWLMELNLMKSELLRRVNAGKRTGKFQQIVFKMDG